MQNNTTTTTTVTAAPLVEAGKKQYTVGSSYEQKLAIAELCMEFERPGSNKKTVKMSEKEAIECLFNVATDRRFVTVPVLESIEVDGEICEVQSIDDDGNLLFETQDLISKAWETIKARDYADESTAKTPLERDLILTRKLCKMLESSEMELEDALAKVRARHAALVL